MTTEITHDIGAEIIHELKELNERLNKLLSKSEEENQDGQK